MPPSGRAEAVTRFIREWLRVIGEPEESLPFYSCHSLRHGAATDLLDFEVPADVVAKAGRWKSIVWFTTYRHFTRLTTKAMAKLGRDSEGNSVVILPYFSPLP